MARSIERCPNCGADTIGGLKQCDDCGKLYCNACYERGKTERHSGCPICLSESYHVVFTTDDLHGNLPGIN